MMSTTLSKLNEMEKEGTPIKVGVIGAGVFAGLTIRQIMNTPGITVSIISDIIEEKAKRAYRNVGYRNKEIMRVYDVEAANHYMDKKVPIITKNNELLIESDIDVILEATGNPEAAAQNAYNAIHKEKDIVIATVETDVLVGAYLAKLADDAGIVYSMAYGDQPALIVELYDWAISTGFRVVAAGEGRPDRWEWRDGIPDDSLQRFGFSQREIKRLNLNPKMYNSFLDGTKCAVEMVSVSNATGLIPEVRGMHFPVGGIRDIPKLFSLKKDGGLLENGGVVEAIRITRPNGKTVRNNLRYGVFIVITSPYEDVLNILRVYGCPMGGKGKNALIYRPVHLAGLEASISLIRAKLYGEATGRPLPRSPVAEVIAAAKRNLKPGDILDGGGGYAIYGLAEKAAVAKEQNLLPFELANYSRVVNKISKDSIITYDDVELDEESFLGQLRKKQDSLFG